VQSPENITWPRQHVCTIGYPVINVRSNLPGAPAREEVKLAPSGLTGKFDCLLKADYAIVQVLAQIHLTFRNVRLALAVAHCIVTCYAT
jgi:hypothetical protein